MVVFMNNTSNKNLIRALDLVRELTKLADQGDDAREDVGCGVLYGTVRDSAYKIKALADSEIAEHKLRGKWRLDQTP